jgi:hypothetical protein
MAPWESFLVVLTDSDEVLPPVDGGKEVSTETEIEGPWSVFFDPKQGGPGEVIFEQLHDWTSDEDPSIRYFSGTAVYRKSLSVPWTGKRIFLALHSLGGAVRVLINGQEAGTVWCSPWMVEVTNYLKKGKNALELQVANSLVNRMIYDASLPEEERLTFSSTPIVKATDPLLPSGIIQVKLFVY